MGIVLAPATSGGYSALLHEQRWPASVRIAPALINRLGPVDAFHCGVTCAALLAAVALLLLQPTELRRDSSPEAAHPALRKRLW